MFLTLCLSSWKSSFLKHRINYVVLSTFDFCSWNPVRFHTLFMEEAFVMSAENRVTFQGEFVFLLNWHSMHE